jgi:hypothetical protein
MFHCENGYLVGQSEGIGADGKDSFWGLYPQIKELVMGQVDIVTSLSGTKYWIKEKYVDGSGLDMLIIGHREGDKGYWRYLLKKDFPKAFSGAYKKLFTDGNTNYGVNASTLEPYLRDIDNILVKDLPGSNVVTSTQTPTPTKVARTPDPNFVSTIVKCEDEAQWLAV